MLKELVIATANEGKYKEFQYLNSNFGNLAEKLIFAPEIANLVVEETGKTYSENSMLKAREWAIKSGLPCLADDSGLEVEALNGAPGLFSARAPKGDKVQWILNQLYGIENRRAKFVASLSICVPKKFILICDGVCKGQISKSPIGANGFGYDPVFIPDGFTKTFAELEPEIKNSISHRTIAFKNLLNYLPYNINA